MLESPERLRHLQPDLVVEKLGLASDAVVADIGSGPGVFSLRLARACPEGVVYAVDVEPRQLDALRSRMAELSLRNVVPVLGSYNDPHLPLRRVDALLIVDTYHHLSDRVAYLRRLRDFLRPGGRLAILEYRPGDLPVGPPAHHKLPEGLRQEELEAAGWLRENHYDTHRYHDFEVWRPTETLN
jgi:ubiquinone/menaquinone biosynthesis C-methylase UbiE